MEMKYRGQSFMARLLVDLTTSITVFFLCTIVQAVTDLVRGYRKYNCRISYVTDNRYRLQKPKGDYAMSEKRKRFAPAAYFDNLNDIDGLPSTTPYYRLGRLMGGIPGCRISLAAIEAKDSYDASEPGILYLCA
ncbi:hypothetical protein QQ045_009947 [Rhodiola kirilowii]